MSCRWTCLLLINEEIWGIEEIWRNKYTPYCTYIYSTIENTNPFIKINPVFNNLQIKFYEAILSGYFQFAGEIITFFEGKCHLKQCIKKLNKICLKVKDSWKLGKVCAVASSQRVWQLFTACACNFNIFGATLGR